VEPTPIEELDSAVEVLCKNKDRWAALDVAGRIDLLQRSMDCTLEAAEDQVRDACKAKGISFDSTTSAEEWLGGPMTTMRNLRLLVDALEDIETFGRPKLKDGAIRKRPDGQLKVEVFPQTGLDKLTFAKFRGEIWMDPSVTEANLKETMAVVYQPGADQTGKVALVLGAGNVASIGPMDVLFKLFVENQVAVIKMNPVNEYLGPHLAKMFKPFVDEGFLRVVYGGAKEGDHLVHHADIDEIHITGSDVIHDIIVWGTGEEQAKNKAAGTPKMTKRISSELGCVTPVIVVPGEWSNKQLSFQAQNVATMVANNASFNCNAAKLIVTWKKWPQREAFLAKVEETLKTLPRRPAYYPGSDNRYDAFLEAHPSAKALGDRVEGALPWTTIFNVDSDNPEDIVFNREAWCAILAETAMSGDTPADYLAGAVEFCNEKVWGTLSCSIIASEETQKQLGSAFEQAVADLRYGSVAVNCWAALSYGLVTTTWGAYPGHTLDNVVSGIGVVHNTFMFEKPQKSVIWGPFVVAPKPPWFSTHKNAHNVAKKLTRFEHSPSFFKFLGIAVSAIRG